MTRLRSILSRFRRDQSGAASVEFVLVAPLFLGFVFATFEAGILMTKSMMLERGVEITSRAHNVGAIGFNRDDFIDDVCERARLVRDCWDEIQVQQVVVTQAEDVPLDNLCAESTAPFSSGGPEEIMFVRVCLPVKPLFPGIGLALHLPKDEEGRMAITAYTAFVNGVSNDTGGGANIVR